MFALLLERSKRVQALDALIKLVECDISTRMSAAFMRNKQSETRPSHYEWDDIYDQCAADEAFIDKLETVRATLPKSRFRTRKPLTRDELLKHYTELLPYIANIIVMADHHGQTEVIEAFKHVHFFVNQQIHRLLWEKGASFDELFFSPQSAQSATQNMEDIGLDILKPSGDLKLVAHRDDNELDIPEFLQPDFEPEPA